MLDVVQNIRSWVSTSYWRALIALWGLSYSLAGHWLLPTQLKGKGSSPSLLCEVGTLPFASLTAYFKGEILTLRGFDTEALVSLYSTWRCGSQRCPFQQPCQLPLLDDLSFFFCSCFLPVHHSLNLKSHIEPTKWQCKASLATWVPECGLNLFACQPLRSKEVTAHERKERIEIAVFWWYCIFGSGSFIHLLICLFVHIQRLTVK